MSAEASLSVAGYGVGGEYGGLLLVAGGSA